MTGEEGQTRGDQIFVVSGCSGSGKSALIAALAQRGQVVATEPGRQIVKDEIQRGGDGLPWVNPQRFIDLAEYDVLVPTYRRHGYEIVFIPEMTVPERVSFVLSTVNAMPLPRRLSP